MTVERMIELLEIEKECVLRNAIGECNRYCAGCDLLQDDTELHEMYTEAIALLDRSAPRVLTEEELKALPDGSVVWEEFFNGEEGESTSIVPALVYAGQITSPDGSSNIDVCARGWPDGDGNAFRYWSSRPTDEQREATSWE